ncbi:hypothetical protein EVAR_45696_1 [Eumeta japonica]|uniref:Uncharacterized protein n=1 Tax=Eumeta variegata TaxID=151549 RepID=A0A4C1XMT9_EUMVA|nr:hypothetical protein EVAR_45696_1 [Eumeta japonica]
MRWSLIGVGLFTLSSKLHTAANQRDGRVRNSPFCVILFSLSAAAVVSSTTARLCWFYAEHVEYTCGSPGGSHAGRVVGASGATEGPKRDGGRSRGRAGCEREKYGMLMFLNYQAVRTMRQLVRDEKDNVPAPRPAHRAAARKDNAFSVETTSPLRFPPAHSLDTMLYCHAQPKVLIIVVIALAYKN